VSPAAGLAARRPSPSSAGGESARRCGGNDPWILSEGIIDISFAITATGTITLGIDGELSDEITHTLRLRLTPPTA
jgi:hypothetical protein